MLPPARIKYNSRGASNHNLAVRAGTTQGMKENIQCKMQPNCQIIS